MGLPFVMGLELADGVGIAPTQPEGSLGFRDRGITALPTIRIKRDVRRVGSKQFQIGEAPETSHFAPDTSIGTRGRNHTFIFDVRSVALYDLSYASRK